MRKYLTIIFIAGCLIFQCGCLAVPTSSPTDTTTQVMESESPVTVDNDEHGVQNNGTDWNTYEPAYIGSLPVGCVVVPDTTPENLSACLQSKLQTSESFSATRYDSEYIKSKIVVEDLIEVQDCAGTAIFNFDWEDTLSSIVFKFEDGGDFTPARFNQLHDEISSFLETDNCWDEQYGLHKDAQNGHYYSCSWGYDDLPCKVTLSCYFDDSGKPSDGMVQFERTISHAVENHSILGTKDSIVYRGLNISARYYGGDYPHVEGSITNNSSATVEFIKIKIALYKNGQVVDTTWTYAVGTEGLEPGESSKWDVYCSDADAITISVID